MKTVLVVDDELQVRQALSYVLERSGYRCATAGSRAEAECALAAGTPDVMLVNATLGAESGLELHRLVRERHGARPAVIFITGRRDLFPEMAAMLGPADDWISKPWDRAELIARVRLAMERTAA